MAKKQTKMVGIIGGMGPHASNRFMEIFYNYKSQAIESNYPRLILDSNTQIPSRIKAIFGKSKSPALAMINSAKKLQQYGCHAIAIPCNTAHAWHEEIKKKVNIPVFNIIDCVCNEIKTKFLKKNINVYVFGTQATQKLGLYENKLIQNKNLNIKIVKKSIQTKIDKIIYLVKKNNLQKKYINDFKKIISLLKLKNKNNLIILGCTELSYFKDINLKNCTLIDSSFVLAKNTYLFCEKK